MMCLSLEIGASDEEGLSLMKCLSLEIGALLEPEGLSLMMCLAWRVPVMKGLKPHDVP